MWIELRQRAAPSGGVVHNLNQTWASGGAQARPDSAKALQSGLRPDARPARSMRFPRVNAACAIAFSPPLDRPSQPPSINRAPPGADHLQDLQGPRRSRSVSGVSEVFRPFSEVFWMRRLVSMAGGLLQRYVRAAGRRTGADLLEPTDGGFALREFR